MRDETGGYDDHEPAARDQADRVLVRPYVPADAEAAEYRLPEGAPEAADLPETDQYPTVTGPVFTPDPTPMPLPGDSGREPPASHVHPDSDRRQMGWLIGSGLALVVAVVVTMIALWPAPDEQTAPHAAPTAAAAPPAAPKPAAPPGSAPPSTAASGPKQSASASASGSTKAGPPTTATGSFAVPPPAAAGGQPAPPVPPAATEPSAPATLAPPPGADRTGPIVGAGGDCLDIEAGIVLLGDELSTRDCNNTSSQRFTLATDGTLRVGGSCARQDGASVTVGICNDDEIGQWRAGPGNSLVNISSRQCLTAAGADVTLSACGNQGQSWALP